MDRWTFFICNVLLYVVNNSCYAVFLGSWKIVPKGDIPLFHSVVQLLMVFPTPQLGFPTPQLVLPAPQVNLPPSTPATSNPYGALRQEALRITREELLKTLRGSKTTTSVSATSSGNLRCIIRQVNILLVALELLIDFVCTVL